MSGHQTIIHADCLEAMRAMAEASVDAVVTDPPYGIRFMGKAWDGADIERRHAERAAAKSHSPSAGPNGAHKSVAAEAGKYDLTPDAMAAFQAFSEAWAREALRVLKPGGHLLSFASARTYHRMASGIEAAGFEIRDQIMWIYGSGFPKSHNGPWGGTALKPAHEPIVVARKPLIGTVAANHAAHGTGALNIDGCRIATGEVLRAGAGGIPCRHDEASPRRRDGEPSANRRYASAGATNSAATPGPRGGDDRGRWPANVVHDGSDEVMAAFPKAPGQQGVAKNDGAPSGNAVYSALRNVTTHVTPRNDVGSAARFFYCAKPGRAERDMGLDQFPKSSGGMVSNTSGQHMTRRDAGYEVAPRANNHPTVKPIELMRWLLRLVTPAGGLALDPFAGSGTTGCAAALEGFRFIGIELDSEYVVIAEHRIAAAAKEAGQASRARAAATAQQEMFPVQEVLP